MRIKLIILLLAAILFPQFSPASEFSLELGLEFSRGDFGTTEDLTAITVPLTISWTPAAIINLSLTIPWISQSEGTTVLVGGRRVGNDPGNRPGNGVPPGGTSTTRSQSSNGPGDMTIDLALNLLRERNLGLSLLGYCKTPSGDETEGLGSGAWDYGYGVGIYPGGEKWFSDFELNYIIPGSNDDFQAENYLDWSARVGMFIGRNWDFSTGLAGGEAPVTGEEDALELTAELNWRNESFGFGGYISRGLREGSADFAAGVFTSRYF